ncbi:MAG: AMP-binding protein, partial [Oscillospiraceae bacterium]|nr:AMP-binding protein [Oscillospiraceae bacterium]
MRFSSFAEMIGHYAERTPDAPALRYANEGVAMTMTYGELRAEILKEIDHTRSLGVEAACHGFLLGDSVSPAELVGLFAAVEMGEQVVMLDANTPVPILRGLLPYTDVDTITADNELSKELKPNLCQPKIKNGAGKVLFFTSGTTERSKAVVLTEKSLCSSAYNGGALLPLTERDTLLCMLPLHHVFGFVCGLLWGLSCGACVALGRGARHYLDDCDFFKPTAVSIVPMLLGFLLKQNLINEEMKLVLVGAGDCPAALLQGARARGLRVSFGYGLTETSSGVALSLGDDPYAMTVCPDDEITIAPDGEILIKVRSCMMKGYYKCPEDTNAVLAGGVLHTGDLGRFDEKGRLHVTGRKKDMLVLPDGTKLFLPEAEAELARLLGGA